ncbi:Gfo/Idh/MocA family protein [Rhizobium binxianense]|uniref:Gfo/Idh/MocA family protein n=1 Tax=Rhizobium binxianense TaxID=3024242 RepID=UPI0023621769|nr:Gfo/Idh/MocA family oxidoreductase [Rhizobium sp. MC62]MDC9813107.1 Gfo/Idh/MocA family oxidoreductase [Rhizobium sp. MC62]
MTHKLGVGVIGCGIISSAYMQLAPNFGGIEIRACADAKPGAAETRAEEFGLRAQSVDDLLASDEIDIVVNLTVPNAHFEVSKAALEAGKHVFSEKPFVLSLADGRKLAEIATAKGLRVGSAPDTFLGGAHQLARYLVDNGAVGKITSGTCFVQSAGMEMWHPNPDFFFQPGGGPILDLGPYCVSNLVQLLGPVKKVVAMSASASEYRTITSKPRFGEKIKVETPTTIHAVLHFASGALVTYCASWDVWQHGHSNMELYGTNGTLHVPDPNFFGGEVRMTEGASFVNRLPAWDHALGRFNDSGRANYRTVGLADMAQAILENRPHRCSMELSLHIVDVLTAILSSAESGSFKELTTTCERPAPLTIDDATRLLAA